MSIKITTDGFNEDNILAKIVEDATHKLRLAGIHKVRIKVVKEFGEPVLKLDADSKDKAELERAAKILGMRL